MPEQAELESIRSNPKYTNFGDFELLKEIEEEEKSDEVDNDSTTEPSATTDISE